MGFTDPIIDGAGALVREAIKSPNFVTDTSGWQIAKDGSAEFNNVSIRGDLVIAQLGSDILVYSGAPAAGTLLLAIAGGAGLDAFGNKWVGGITFFSPPSVAFSGLNLKTDSLSNGLDGSLKVDGAQGVNLAAVNFAATQPNIRLGGLNGGVYNDRVVISGDTVVVNGLTQFGNGEKGGYFAGNWIWAESRASNTLASIAAVTNTGINSDYPIGTGFGEGFTGGAWKPYVNGYYDIFFFMGAAAAATREACIIRKNGVEIAHNEAPNATNLATFVISEFLSTTDTIDFRPFYVSTTTPQSLTGRINIARRF